MREAEPKAVTRIDWTSEDPKCGHASLTLPSDLSSVDPVEETAQTFATEAGFDPDTASHIAMVAREAAVNAILHGNKSDPAKTVGVTFALTADALTIRISDQGAGLDPSTLPDPLSPENLLRPSGRGVFLMRALMDEVDFRTLNPGTDAPGTEITLVKRRAPQS